jgi:mycoredoxin
MDENQIQYDEIDIEKDENAMKFIQEINSGMNSVPTIIFPDESIMVEPTTEEFEKKAKDLGLL